MCCSLCCTPNFCLALKTKPTILSSELAKKEQDKNNSLILYEIKYVFNWDILLWPTGYKFINVIMAIFSVVMIWCMTELLIFNILFGCSRFLMDMVGSMQLILHVIIYQGSLQRMNTSLGRLRGLFHQHSCKLIMLLLKLALWMMVLPLVQLLWQLLLLGG